MKKYKFVIGVDPGAKTGFAIWDCKAKEFLSVDTLKIHQAIFVIMQKCNRPDVLVLVEDARKRVWYGDAGRGKLQGVGSVKRDCSIWEDLLKDLECDYRLLHPKDIKTKLDSVTFERITGYKFRTSQHARDAAMMCYGY